MSQNNQPTWKDIAKAVLSKSKEDYQERLKPKVIHTKNKVGILIETLGRRIQK